MSKHNEFVYVGEETDDLVPGQTGDVYLEEPPKPFLVAWFEPHGGRKQFPIQSSYDLWSGNYDYGDGTIWDQLNRMYRHLKEGNA